MFHKNYMDSFTYIFVMSLRLIFKVELEQINHIFEGINIPIFFTWIIWICLHMYYNIEIYNLGSKIFWELKNVMFDYLIFIFSFSSLVEMIFIFDSTNMVFFFFLIVFLVIGLTQNMNHQHVIYTYIYIYIWTI